MRANYRPIKLDEALAIRAQGAIPFAGGTDLMVAHRVYSGTSMDFPAPLLFTDQIRELRGVSMEEGSIEIGGSLTMTELLNIPQLPPPLIEALALIAAPGIRNRATLGGNICNASPAGDGLVPLYLLDAEVILASPRGERTLALKNFITGVRKLDLKDDELLRAVKIPRLSFDFWGYRKVGTRRANALSKLSFAAALNLDRGGVVEDFRVALGAVAPRVVRLRELEETFIGRKLKDISPTEAAQAWKPHIRPINDQRSTAAYRSGAAENLIAAFLSRIQEEL